VDEVPYVDVAPSDYVAVQQLLGTYCQLADLGDGSAWANLFAEDGEFVVGDGTPVRGRNELAAVVQDVPQREVLRHWVGAPVVTEASENALMLRTYSLNLSLPGDGMGLTFIRRTTTAEWHLVKVRDVWKILRRVTRVNAEV
jgi:hypothetical protein